MKKLSLRAGWRMDRGAGSLPAGELPCSMYAALIDNNIIENPYFRENEKKALEYSRNDCTFRTQFNIDGCGFARPYICFEMLDTLAEISVNGVVIGQADNMHRTWRFPLGDALCEGTNELCVRIASPLEYAERMNAKRHLWGVDETTVPGYQYIRKAHYMYGWDWGPQLPDMGIYRDVYIYDDASPRISDLRIVQRHCDNKVELDISPVIEAGQISGELAAVSLTAPDGAVIAENVPVKGGHAVVNVNEPELWWPNGIGAQPLYTLTVTLFENGEETDSRSQRVGLRELTISRENDNFGQEFCFKCNGAKIFAMGADYIPEDNIIPFVKHENTRRLLEHCKRSNFNCIRVWGGGYYPDDEFFDYCDELGLIVWLDNMFACAAYVVDDHFAENIRRETEDNVIRLHNHACLGLWCGNNEMETAWECWGLPQEPDLIEGYSKMFDHIIKDAVEQYDGVTPYWPSSPSSGVPGVEANDFNHGDVHYWAVWHNMKPMSDALKYYFRFCSEYGFEAMPDRKTLESVLLPEDMNLYSPAMEAHHKCVDGNHKLVFYLGECVRMPVSCDQLIYASQLMQAEAIRMNVEHMRRNRGRCMGSIYWQFNDSNPTISWASVDYYQRWKALQYFAGRFYAPVLLSATEENGSVSFNISNESLTAFNGKVKWSLCDNRSNVIESGEYDVSIAPLCAIWTSKEHFGDYISTDDGRRTYYLRYFLESDGRVISGSVIQFAQFKHYYYLRPTFDIKVTEDADSFKITLLSDVYAKDIRLELAAADCVFSDNWFDMHAGEPVSVMIDKSTLSKPLDIAQLRDELRLCSIYDIGREGQSGSCYTVE